MGDWIQGMVEGMGPLGIGLLMFLENVFPPIPSELIMPLAGFYASNGEVSIVLVIIAGTIGSLLGATFWYVVGRVVSEERLKKLAERHGRWLTVTPDEIEKADRWFDAHGHWAVMVGRLLPTIRTLISIPAGLSEMPAGKFLVYSGIGSAIWVTALAMIGYALGSEYEAVEHWINPVSTAVVVLIVLLYVYRVVTFGRRTKKAG